MAIPVSIIAIAAALVLYYSSTGLLPGFGTNKTTCEYGLLLSLLVLFIMLSLFCIGSHIKWRWLAIYTLIVAALIYLN